MPFLHPYSGYTLSVSTSLLCVNLIPHPGWKE
jgi:hypothetical protein